MGIAMMPAERTTLTIAGVPAVLVSLGSPERAAERGTVLYYHGFGGTKDDQSPPAYPAELADAGFLAVSLDAVGHGARRYPDFGARFSDERWDSQFDATESDFLQVIDETAAELPSIIDELLTRGLAAPGRIAVTGRSMGGNVAYAGALADSRISAIVSVVGCPQWTLPRPHSPHYHPDRFYPVAVLSLAAEQDEHSPAAQIREFHASLTPHYAAAPDRAEYVEYAEVGHFLTPELNEDSSRLLVAWCVRWLLSGATQVPDTGARASSRPGGPS